MKTKTLICALSNFPANNSTFGSELSKVTGIQYFDLPKQLAKFSKAAAGPSYIAARKNLFQKISQSDVAIIGTSWMSDISEIAPKFEKKIVILPDNQEESKVIQRLVSDSAVNCGDINETVYSTLIKAKASALKMMNPALVVCAIQGQEEMQILELVKSAKKLKLI